MGNLYPGEKIIYERVDTTIYGRYANKPDIPRWVIGSTDTQLKPTWHQLEKLAEESTTFKGELDKLLTLYYLLK
jgi:hypothetical protein